jgi:chitinase
LTPELRAANDTVGEGNAAGRAAGDAVARFTIRRTGGMGPATVEYRTVQGTATAPADYATRRGTLSFAEGQASRAISVPIAADALDEVNERFTLRLSSPTGGARIADGEGVATIVDDDPAPRVSVEDVSLFEGDAGTVSARFNVRLSAASGRTVSVAYATSDGTARQPGDYTSRAGTVSFAPGERLRTIAVSVRGETRVEPNERFWLTLTAPSGAQLGDALASALIRNDD